MTNDVVAAERLPSGHAATPSLPSTSTIRFTLLIALVIVTSAVMGMYLSLLNRSAGRLIEGAVPCLNNKGIALGGSDVSVEAWGTASVQGCVAPLRTVVLLGMTALAVAVVTVGYLLYAVLPWWRVRRHRLVPLPAEAQALHGYLDSLVREVELPRAPEFLVAPYNRLPAGLAFGRQGHPRVQLNAGLVPMFGTDRMRFRAVVLHELAHVRNRDIGKTYFTVAIWRAFLLVALAPFVVLNVFPHLVVGLDRWSLTDVGNDLVRSTKIQSVAAVAALTALIYLTRAAVLRSREHLADATAVAYGAESLIPILSHAVRQRPTGGRLAALLRSHPPAGRRLRYLDEPGQQSRFSLGEVFAAGVAISAIGTGILFVGETIVKEPWFLPHLDYVSVLASLSVALVYSVLVALYFSVIYWRVALGASRGEVATPAIGPTAAVMSLGILLGEPLSLAGALGGLRWGIFGGVAIEGNLASGAVSALVLFAGVLLLARWTRDSAALRLARPHRPSLRGAYLATAAIGGCAFLCGFWIWYLFHGSVANGRVDRWTEGLAGSRGEPYAALPGIGWINAQYAPLEFLAFVPFATVALALPWIYVVNTARVAPRLPVGRLPVGRALWAGFGGGMLYVVTTGGVAWLAAPWVAEKLTRYGSAATQYLLYSYFHLASIISALVAVVVVATAPRLGITLGLAASFVCGTIATASMPFTYLLARCAAHRTGGQIPACLAGKAPAALGVYPYVFNEIVVRSALGALAAGLLWTAVLSGVNKLRGSRPKLRSPAPTSEPTPDRTPDGEPATSRRARVWGAVGTVLLLGIALTVTVINTVDMFGSP